MYIQYKSDREALGYEKAVIDVSWRKKLGRITKISKITNSIFLILKNRRKIIITNILGSAFLVSTVQQSSAIGLSVPSFAPMVRVQPRFEDSLKNTQYMKLIPLRHDFLNYKYNYSSRSKEEVLFMICITDRRLASDRKIAKLANELRGGNLSLIGTAAFLAVMIMILSVGESFILNPGWRLIVEHQNRYMPPNARHRFPPSYDFLDFLFPRTTCYRDRPGGCNTMTAENPQSSREELTQLSTDYNPTKTQISGFVENGKVNLREAFNEVNRRASEMGCENFECSFERFKELATECGEIDDRHAREAITILHGEMQGYYKNARRIDYGLNVKSIDFRVDGLGKFANITHAEAKNAVGSGIQIADGFEANIWKQGRSIGKKSVWQKNFWSNTTRTIEVPNIKPDADLPESVNNILTVVDVFDVPTSEKERMGSAINSGAKNDTNLIILNNNTNI